MTDEAQRQIPPGVLAPIYEAARGRWPDLQVDREAFAATLRACRPDSAAADSFEWVTGLNAPDLYLVCAAVAGNTRAAAHLGELAGVVARQIVDRHNWCPMPPAELATVLLSSLLVTEGGKAPRLGQYGGRGSLAGFLRVCAIRIAADERDGGPRSMPLDDLGLAEKALGTGNDEEIDRLKQLYRPAFELAMREALAELPPRDRNLLRLHHFERLPCERIATLYSVHTTTVWRWIERIYRDVRADILRRLADRFGAELADAESIVRLVWSHVDESLRLVLLDETP